MFLGNLFSAIALSTSVGLVSLPTSSIKVLFELFLSIWTKTDKG